MILLSIMLIGPSKGACGLDLGLLAARGAMQTMDKINRQRPIGEGIRQPAAASRAGHSVYSGYSVRSIRVLEISGSTN